MIVLHTQTTSNYGLMFLYTTCVPKSIKFKLDGAIRNERKVKQISKIMRAISSSVHMKLKG